ncbi:Ribose operon repressor [Paenibacillus auburnensis]|jgi:LacI family transcriptional regulator, kdg operon repressor|uniref:Ribose operon repressor n=1 Tax=Paenibacillus auburnensis TaxID=2905649 RepID=A0ABM9CSY4_9BACL|nr:LacI family DNA-binding transcriptional regulator [Paenibacillus auburnensis]CAH1222781.1 Ribose operon repressor [Paenibacillus auburnensis]
MGVTMKDVAELAGVSKSTVSQFLSKRYNYMSADTKKKIEQAIEELGYIPNEVARSLKHKKTYIVGVISSTILSRFTTEVVRAIEDECQLKGIQVIVCNTDDDPLKEKEYVQSMIARQVDGLIIFPTEENKKLYASLLKNGYPFVFVDRKVNDISVDTVLLNNEKASELAVETFIRHNHTRIGIITFPLGKKTITTRSERLSGYRKTLDTYGLAVNEGYIKSGRLDQLQGLIDELFHMDSPPTSIVATNDMILEQVLIYAKRNQLTIPDDFSLIGIDDVSFASFYTPPITTISQPSFEMGKRSARLLLDKIDQREQEPDGRADIIRLDPAINHRESVHKLSLKDKEKV